MADMLTEALRLRKLGFAVHWLRPNSKIPVAEGWSDAPVMNESALTASYRPGFNVGFRPGKWSVVEGREVCVLDIDIRGGPDYAEEANAAAKSMLDGMYQPNVITGSGVGRHQHLGFPIGKSPPCAATTLRQSDIWIDEEGQPCRAGTRNARPAWLIELLSTGKNVVLPPSIHPDTLKPYKWAES
jgi:hypothetical protein